MQIRFSRSEALIANYNIPRSVSTSVKRKCPEYVELTYDSLRVGPDGEFLAYIKDGVWWLEDDQYPFSDIVVSP